MSTESQAPKTAPQAPPRTIRVELPADAFTAELEALGRERGPAYRSATPFPHTAFDGLIHEGLLEKVMEEFSAPPAEDWELRELEAKSKNKQIAGPQQQIGPYTRHLLAQLGSPRFLRFVEELTGIRGLIPDPYLHGGGLHEIGSGGYLELHSDFNWHGHLHMYRRLNLLLYLNKDWQEEWEGALELWDSRLEQTVKYYPLWNRLIIQHVTSDAMHGFPATIRCPEDRTRKSIAMWLYTSELPVDVQCGYDQCEPDFILRAERAHPLPRPLWRRLVPPIVTAYVKKKRQTKSFSKIEFWSAFTRFVPPIVVDAWQRVAGKSGRGR